MTVHSVRFSDEDWALVALALERSGGQFGAFSREAILKEVRRVLEVPHCRFSTEELTERVYEIAYGTMALLIEYVRREGGADLVSKAESHAALLRKKMYYRTEKGDASDR